MNKFLQNAESILPVIILIEPQLGENIGAVARAMLNCGLKDLRLVNPRDGWPNGKAVRASSGADEVIRNTSVFSSTQTAVADLHHVCACTSRSRDINKKIYNAEEVAKKLHKWTSFGHTCGIVFGGERSGLCNDDISLSDTIVSIPLNPDFSSLNLAQAVLIIAYSWFRANGNNLSTNNKSNKNLVPATKTELHGLFDHLEAELLLGGFLFPPEKAPKMVRNLRALLQRAQLSEREVKTLRGVISAIKRAGASN